MTFSRLSYTFKCALSILVISLSDEREALSHPLLGFRRRRMSEDPFENECGSREVSGGDE